MNLNRETGDRSHYQLSKAKEHSAACSVRMLTISG
jgi:hypothetical protein